MRSPIIDMMARAESGGVNSRSARLARTHHREGWHVVAARKPNTNRCPVGTVRVRTRHKRGGERRAFVKVAEPNEWVLMARHVWEQANGPIPPGMGIHHKDEDKLNDTLANLELVSKADHLAIHRAEFKDRAIVGFVAARRKSRWTTKSATKRVGRHPKDCDCPLHRTSKEGG